MIRSRAIVFCMLLLGCVLFSANPVEGFWDRNGNLVSGAAGHDDQPRIVPDGAGGMILVWRNGTADVFAQRMDGSGVPVWAAGGVYVASGYAEILGAVPDQAGGAIVVWFDGHGDFLIATRISPDGSLVWPSQTVTIAAPGGPTNVTVAADGSGGALLAWLASAAGMRGHIQKLDRDGHEVWSPGGLQYSPVGQAGDEDYRPHVVADGAGGALISYTDEATPSKVYVQRVYSNESTWSPAGTHANYVSGLSNSGFHPRLAHDGAGGTCVAWVSAQQSITRVDVQFLDAAGNRLLALPVGVSGGAAEEHADIDMLADGSGGAYLAWREFRDGKWSVFAQRVDAFGHRLWPEDGLAVSPDANYDRAQPRILDAGSGNVIVSWVDDDFRTVDYPLHARKFDPGGVLQWNPGVTIVMPDGYNAKYDVACDGSGGLLAAIPKETTPGEVDVYAQFLNIFGVAASPEPVIQSVTDVPGDQGGAVRITIGSSDRDCLEQTEAQVRSYDVWQRVDGPLLRAGSAETGGASPLTGEDPFREELTFFREGSRRFVRAAPKGAFPAGTWELVGSFGASQADEYIYRAPTLVDSIGSEQHYSVFTIAAMTTDPSVWFASAPDSGYSVDNLAPAPPTGLAGALSHAPQGLQLTWDPNAENDLWYYAVYRGTTATPDPNLAQLIATPLEAEYFDDAWEWEPGFWYLVTAVDLHDNESDPVVLIHDQITGVDPMSSPKVTFLGQNFPNPFNPSSTIAFGLDESGFVNLSIYDAAGRLVEVLVDEVRPEGRFTAEWRGTSRGGRDAASGVYFCKLTVGDFVRTKKMMLVR